MYVNLVNIAFYITFSRFKLTPQSANPNTFTQNLTKVQIIKDLVKISDLNIYKIFHPYTLSLPTATILSKRLVCLLESC